MAIESLSLLLGIVIVSCGTRFVPHSKIRQWLLLGTSYSAYIHWAGLKFSAILIASSLLNYAWGAVLRRRPTTALLWVGVTLNVLLLGVFKYLPAIATEIRGIPQADLLRQIILPLGISFWTFQG